MFPIRRALDGYGLETLRRDSVAGVTVAALAIPAGMAYAQLAGLSPVAGLYALLLPAIAYALFGSSRQLSVGPEAAIATLTAGALAPLAAGGSARYAGLAALLAIIIAALYGLARLLRLGWLADYFSRPVLVGYIHGVAVILVIGQLEKLFGVSIDAADPVPQLVELFREIGDVNGPTVIVGLSSLVALVVLRWLWPKVPGALVVVVAGIAASYAMALAADGVATVGAIPGGLPGIEMPSVQSGDALQLLPAAMGIFAVGYVDAILTARSFAGRAGQHVRANQELTALGTATLAAGITQGFPIGASGSRTAVNVQMGGRTQAVGFASALTVAIVLLVLTAPMSYLPIACLGAIIVVAAISLLDLDAWKALARSGRAEVVIAALTMVGVIAVGVLQALIIAVALSIVDVARRSAKPHDAVLGFVPRLGRYADVSLHPSAVVTAGVVVYRLDDRLIFVNVEYMKGRVREAIAGAETPTRWLVFDAEGVASIDSSGAEALAALIDDLRADDITLVIARAKSMLLEQFADVGLTARIGSDNVHPTVEHAVRACAGTDAGGAGSP